MTSKNPEPLEKYEFWLQEIDELLGLPTSTTDEDSQHWERLYRIREMKMDKALLAIIEATVKQRS